MNATIQILLERHQYSEAMSVALRLFAEGNTSPLVLREQIEKYGATAEDLRLEAVDVIIDYVELILEDNVLSAEEMRTLRMMKLFFRIKEGDFLQQHKEKQIEHILYRQLELIYLDKRVDRQESMMKVELQELFGLSYDQFLLLEQEAAETALKNGADIKDLDTFYVL